MDVSVIIPTYNRIDSLKMVLAGLARQTIAPSRFEVVVVSDGAVDGTNEYLQTLAVPYSLKFSPQTNQGVAAARNTGIHLASGDYILFLDDDVVPAPALLAQHLHTHENCHQPKSTVVLGPMLTPPDFEMVPWVHWEQSMLVKQYQAMESGAWQPTARQFFTGNTSLARCHLLAAGGFDPQFTRAEDLELAFRLADAGLTFVFNGKAIGYHYAERSYASWYKIPYVYGKNDVIFAQDKGQPWILPVIWREFLGRNVLVQGMTWLCLDRPLVSTFFNAILKGSGIIGYRVGLMQMANLAFSGIFNLRYYQGVADQLGRRSTFFAGVTRERKQRLKDAHHIDGTVQAGKPIVQEHLD